MDNQALSQSGRLRIFQALLADNNALVRSFLRDILVRHFPFIVVAEAGDGDRALALDAELHPQLVFLDIKLPDRSGLDLARQFKSSNPEVLICLVTQFDIPEYRAAARECGADHVIVMGESSETAIVAMLEATLSGYRRTPPIDAKDESHDQEECISDLPG